MAEMIRKIAELTSGDTTTATVRGSSDTTYRLEPTMWLKDIMEAAQHNWYFAEACDVYETEPGQKDMVIPYRKKFLASGDFANSYSAAAEITATKLDNLDGIRISPSPYAQRMSIENHAIRINAVNIVKAARDELTNYASEVVEAAISAAILAATKASVGVNGYQTLYGGSATSDNGLSVGDVLTPAMVSKAKARLQSKKSYYWTGGVETLNTVEKNPWNPSPDAPFILFVTPEVEDQLRQDSQFTDASVYGGREVVLNGEVGKYIGVKVISSNFVPTYAIGAAAPDGGSVFTAAAARCFLVKAKKCAALVWGLKPTLKASPFDREASLDIILEVTFGTDTIYDDAIVALDVALQ